MFTSQSEKCPRAKMKKLLLLMVIFSFTRAAEENEIVVRILGGPRVARMISEEMGYYYKGPVSCFSIQLK